MKFLKSLLYIIICFFLIAFFTSNSMADFTIAIGKKMSDLDKYLTRVEDEDGGVTFVVNDEALSKLSADELRDLFDEASDVVNYFQHSSDLDAKPYYNQYSPLVSAIQDKLNAMGEHTSDNVPSNESESDLLAYTTLDQVYAYLINNNIDGLSDNVKNHFNSIIDSNRGSASQGSSDIREEVVFCQARMQGLSVTESNKLARDDTSFLESNPSLDVFKEPGRTNTASTESGIDDVITQGDDFNNAGAGATVYNQGNLQNFSKSLYNILLSLGVAAAVIVGMILGVKFTMSGVDEKADVKKQLFIYVAGCVIVFGAFAIWKLVVDVLSQI